jgi:hypothetical protein
MAVVLLLAVLAACTGPQIQDAKSKYLLARMEYNDLLEEYLDLKAKQSPEVRAEWKRTVDPKCKAVGEALNAWGKAVKAAEASGEESNQLEAVRALTDVEKAFQKALPALLSLVKPLLTKGGDG